MVRYPLLLCIVLPAWALAADVAVAAPPTAPSLPAVSVIDPLKTAFESLPDAQRRTLQDALVWTGDFNGAVAGSYGPRTRDALLAHAKRIGLPPEAALSGAARAKLLATAAAARSAVGFATLRDSRAGLAIGLPLTLLPVRTQLPDGTRYAAPDSSAVVDTTGRVAGPGGLDDMLARLTRDAPGRRITYKLAKPDFIVVSGEVGDRKFYSRYAIGRPGSDGPAIRGFTLSYPAAVTAMDRIVLAVAASFDPFPSTAPNQASAPQTAAIPAPMVQPPVPARVLAGQAVLIGPGLALTRSDPTRCRLAQVDGVPATWLRQDRDTGLAILALPGHRDAALVKLSTMEAGAARLVLFLVPGKTAPQLSAATATPAGAGGIRAPLQGADAGAVLVDEAGDLAGVARASDARPVLVGGIVTSARYDVVEARRLSDFLAAASVPVSPSSASPSGGNVLARWTTAVLPLRCQAEAATP